MEVASLAERRGLCRLSILVGGLMLLFASTAAPAMAQSPGLPRGYDIQRVDSPAPFLAGGFGLQTSPVGDVNGDGEDDFATNQTAGTPGDEGQIWVYSGENGSLLGTFTAPDSGGPAVANNNRALVDRWLDRLGDIGSCPAANAVAGQTCPSATIGAPDGGADFLVGGEGVDVPTPGVANPVRDAGRVWVIDGKTRAVLKRIDMPVADRQLLAARQTQFPLPTTNVRGGFGRTAITPRGLPVCNGNAGVTTCPPLAEVPQAVRIGDMDGAGQPDIVIGANRFTEIGATAAPGSHCAVQQDPQGICHDAGRAYVYRGEDIAGSNPAVNLETPLRTIRNPGAQSDVNDITFARSEIFGHAMFPIGDVGSCRVGGAQNFPAVGPGEKCSQLARTNVQDGKPDVIISAHRADATPFDPDPSRFEEGYSFLIDGATGSYLHIYHHPEPQPNALFGYTTRQSFPVGDMGSSVLPDLVQGAFQNAQDRDGRTLPQAGKLYLLDGNFNAAFPVMQILNDPTPVPNGRFGIAREGVGDLVPGNTGKEMLIGVFPGNIPGDNAFTDLHFINASSGNELQRISDPDRQLRSSFGYQVTPLGDLNEDNFQDFATAAPNWDSATVNDAGRIYIYRSNNTPAATPPTTPRTYPTPTPTPTTPTPPTPAGCGAGKRTLVLTSGNDTRNGTTGADLIFGGAGNDIIDALAGDDCIDLGLGDDRGQGGDGKDLILGSGGDDRVLGNDDNDRLQGGPGGDNVQGGLGNDTLHGQSGNDSVSGSRGRDRMNGGSGRDRMSGGSSADRVSGDAGNDRISGGSSNDVLKGNSGNDVINGGSGRDRISCGRGRDTVIADRRDRVARDCERVRRR